MDINDVMKTFVDQYAPMNPETEFFIPKSSLLQNGMEILLAYPNQRASKAEIERGEDYSISLALERNRWCKVSHLELDRRNNVYTFVGTYSDGIPRKRTTSVNEPWLVKLDSVDVLKQTRDAVHDLVNDAMQEQDAASCVNNGCNSVLTAFAESTTENILQIFGMGVSKK